MDLMSSWVGTFPESLHGSLAHGWMLGIHGLHQLSAQYHLVVAAILSPAYSELQHWGTGWEVGSGSFKFVSSWVLCVTSTIGSCFLYL